VPKTRLTDSAQIDEARFVVTLVLHQMQKVEDLKNHTAKNNILKRQVYTECISSIFFFQFTSAGTAPGKKKS